MTSVRTHTRHTKNGTTTVHRHDRSTRSKTWHQMQKTPRRTPRGVRNLGRAFGYARRHKRTAALGFGTLGTFQLAAFATSRGLMGLGLVAALFCLVFFGPLVWSIRKDLHAARAARESAAVPESTQRRNSASAQTRKSDPTAPKSPKPPKPSRPRRSAASILRGPFGPRRSAGGNARAFAAAGVKPSGQQHRASAEQGSK